MTAVVIALSFTQLSTASGAFPKTDSRVGLTAASELSQASGAGPAAVAAPEKCRSARRAVAFLRARTWERQSARGGELADRTPVVHGRSCHWARYVAGVWIARAKAARKALAAWEYDYAWWLWLPAKWRRVFHCETPTNGQYINWQHHAGSYEGGPGFYSGTWDRYKPAGAPSAAYLATPREQYQAAENVRAAVGYGAWGCGGR